MVRLPPVEVEGDCVTQRLRHVQWLVTDLEPQQHEAAAIEDHDLRLE
jgi:hypothetical protein